MPFRFIIISLILFFVTDLFAELKIEKIQFIGNKFRNSKQLRSFINSEQGNDYEPRLLKLDKILLTNLYRKNGFLTIEIKDSLYYTDRRQKINMTFVINEGQRYYFGGVRFTGAGEITESQLKKPFKNIKPHTPFDESLVTDAHQQIEDIYYNSGKPFVQIQYDYRFEQDSLVYALFDIEENQTVFIKDIKYFGLKLVQKFLIRRELEFTKRDQYNREALEYSQQNIYSTGLFRFVRFEIEPIESEPQNVILNILVQEKDARWIGFQFGVAHEQDEFHGNKFDLTLQGGHRNIWGTARSVSLHLTPSFWYGFEDNQIINPQNRYVFQFVEPWIGNTRTPGIFQLAYNQKRPINFAHSNELLASFQAKHLFKKPKLELSGTITAKLIDSTFTKTAVKEPKEKVYSLTFYGKKDTRPNLFNPKDGSLTDLSISLSNSSSQDNNQNTVRNSYTTVIASWSRYQPYRPAVLKKKFHWTLASRFKVGTILDIGSNSNIPFTELFTAGGATTVRGYQEQLLGPAAKLDNKGKIDEAAGGKMIFLANIEVRFPIIWLFVGEVFVDAGNVWRNVDDFSPGTIRPSTGFGMALLTPLGPIRLDYGYKLNRIKTDPTPDAIHAGIYFAF